MRTHWRAQAALLSALWSPEWEVQKGRDISVCVAASFCCIVETKTTFKNFFK